MTAGDIVGVTAPEQIAGWSQTHDYVFGHPITWAPGNEHAFAFWSGFPVPPELILVPVATHEILTMVGDQPLFMTTVHRYPPDAVEFPRDSAAFADRRQRADGMRLWTDPATVMVGGQPTLTLDARWALTAGGGYRRMYALEAWVPRPYGLFNLRSQGPEEGIALGKGVFLTALGSWTWYR